MIRKLTLKGDGFDKDGNYVVFTIVTQTTIRKAVDSVEKEFEPFAKAMGLSKSKARKTEVFLP